MYVAQLRGGMVLPCPLVLNRVIFFAPIHLRQVMEQEGWHYELENKDEPLTYKGVVFNEMKGVYSSPDSLHGRTCQQVNPRTCQSTRQPLLLAVKYIHPRSWDVSFVESSITSLVGFAFGEVSADPSAASFWPTIRHTYMRKLSPEKIPM